MTPEHPRIIIAEVSALRLLSVCVVLGLFFAGFIYVGLATGILSLSGPLTLDRTRFAEVTVIIGAFWGWTLFLLLGNAANGGAGLYVVDGNLVQPLGRRRTAPMSEIISISTGPEGIFEGEPRSITFELVGGTLLTASTLFFKTPMTAVIERLQAAGLKVPTTLNVTEPIETARSREA